MPSQHTHRIEITVDMGEISDQGLSQVDRAIKLLDETIGVTVNGWEK